MINCPYSVCSVTFINLSISRYAKELIGLDLKNCRHWNPFLEVNLVSCLRILKLIPFICFFYS